MKKISNIFLFVVMLFLVTAMIVQASGAYDSGFIPMKSSCFLGAEDVESTGWYSDGGTLSLQISGGYKGNNYLQFEPEEGAISPKFDIAPYLPGAGTYTLNIYIRLSGIDAEKENSIQAKVGDQLLAEQNQPIQKNRWFLYSSPVTITENGESEAVFEFVTLPDGCSRICIDGFAVLPFTSSGTAGGSTEDGSNQETGNTSVTEKKTFQWYSNLRNKSVGTVRSYYADVYIFSALCIAVAVAVSLIILFIPFKKILTKIKNRASAK